MRKRVYLLLLLAVVLGCLLLASCSGEEIDHEHKYVERTIGPNGESDATCTTDAKKEKVCVVCADTILIEVLTAKGHTPNDWQVKTEPTCTVGKVSERICKDCGIVVETKAENAVGHNPGDWQTLTNGTCTQNHIEGRLCKTCGETVETKVNALEGHIPGEWQVIANATCTENSVEGRACTKCGEIVEKLVGPSEGHTPGDWQVVTDASCTQNLIEGKACTKCGEVVETKAGSKIQHEYSQTVIGSTCLVGEHIVHTCIHCGDSYGTDYAAPTEEHIWGDTWIIEVAPTCSSDGVKKKICTACSTGTSYESVPMDQNNHSFLVETFPPVDGEEGYVKYTCKGCGYEITNIYESNYLPSQIYEMVVSSTVRIEACNKDGKLHNLGSGFFISNNGEIVTNFHVIAGAYQLKVKLHGGDEYPVTAIKGYDVANDLVILKIDLEGNSCLNISTDEIKTGDPVYALGSPLGVDDVFTDGIVSNPSKKVNGLDMIVFSAPVAPGNSGGPLVNARGEVIGINNQVADDGQNLNFALKASLISEVDVSTEKSVYDVYKELLSSTSINVLAYYLTLNYDSMVEDKEYTKELVLIEETDGKYGRNLQVTYNKELKAIVVKVIWVDGGKHLYTVEFILDSIGDGYKVKFFDHIWSQYTMEATVSTKTQAVNSNGALDTSVFNKIFTFDYINYGKSNNDSLTESIAKQLMGVAYISMLDGFEAMLEGTNTELTLECFNFQEAIIKEQE